jgi:hypothetical protein
MSQLFIVRSFRLVCIFGLSAALSASGQVQKPALTAALKGIETVSSVMIGDKGSPVGYQAPYPVNTLVYPDGKISYRVEWAMMRGDVGQMQKSFGSGTTFQISGVDFKDDRLELKLTSRDRDEGRLKVMLGAGVRGRPPTRPWALARCKPAIVLSLKRTRSWRATAARIPMLVLRPLLFGITTMFQRVTQELYRTLDDPVCSLTQRLSGTL